MRNTMRSSPEERIVFALRMVMGEQPLSGSLTMNELIAQGRGTRLVHTEQGAYFGEGSGSQASLVVIDTFVQTSPNHSGLN